ncbi:hypothetical protein KJ359_010646 [Pestalotiopsis sp. 9143b]|nr:hypothetical protein KJ359_010646 [Pestalotiopsis sp. 9143b]
MGNPKQDGSDLTSQGNASGPLDNVYQPEDFMSAEDRARLDSALAQSQYIDPAPNAMSNPNQNGIDPSLLTKTSDTVIDEPDDFMSPDDIAALNHFNYDFNYDYEWDGDALVAKKNPTQDDGDPGPSRRGASNPMIDGSDVGTPSAQMENLEVAPRPGEPQPDPAPLDMENVVDGNIEPALFHMDNVVDGNIEPAPWEMENIVNGNGASAPLNIENVVTWAFQNQVRTGAPALSRPDEPDLAPLDMEDGVNGNSEPAPVNMEHVVNGNGKSAPLDMENVVNRAPQNQVRSGAPYPAVVFGWNLATMQQFERWYQQTIEQPALRMAAARPNVHKNAAPPPAQMNDAPPPAQHMAPPSGAARPAGQGIPLAELRRPMIQPGQVPRQPAHVGRANTHPPPDPTRPPPIWSGVYQRWCRATTRPHDLTLVWEWWYPELPGWALNVPLPPKRKRGRPRKNPHLPPPPPKKPRRYQGPGGPKGPAGQGSGIAV